MTTDYERWMRDARARLGGGETERLGDVALAGAFGGGDDVGGFDRVVLGGVFGIDERDGAGGFGVAARGQLAATVAQRPELFGWIWRVSFSVCVAERLRGLRDQARASFGGDAVQAQDREKYHRYPGQI